MLFNACYTGIFKIPHCVTAVTCIVTGCILATHSTCSSTLSEIWQIYGMAVCEEVAEVLNWADGASHIGAKRGNTLLTVMDSKPYTARYCNVSIEVLSRIAYSANERLIMTPILIRQLYWNRDWAATEIHGNPCNQCDWINACGLEKIWSNIFPMNHRHRHHHQFLDCWHQE